MTTDTLSQHAVQDRMNRAQAEQMDQYTLWQILGIWAIGALPMALLAWVGSCQLQNPVSILRGFSSALL